MITLLKKSTYKESLWKNGRGKTQQIDIYPQDAEVLKSNFDWRISSATITSSDPFSKFDGYMRQLIVWKGEGLKLNGDPLLPYTPFAFSGEDEIYCELIGAAPVVDLGIIYNKDRFTSELSALRFQTNASIDLGKGLYYFFIAEGADCQINGFDVSTGDTVMVEDEETIQVKCTKNAQLTIFIFKLIKI